MSAIVTTYYRYKRPSRKRNAVALNVPAVVKAEKKGRRAGQRPELEMPPEMRKASSGTPMPADYGGKPAIITARNPKARIIDTGPDLSAEEVRQRGEAAKALWRDLVRRVREA